MRLSIAATSVRVHRLGLVPALSPVCSVCARWEEGRRSDGRWALLMVSPGLLAMSRWAWQRWTRFPDRWAREQLENCGMARWPFAPLTSLRVQRRPRWPPTASPLGGFETPGDKLKDLQAFLNTLLHIFTPRGVKI